MDGPARVGQDRSHTERQARLNSPQPLVLSTLTTEYRYRYNKYEVMSMDKEDLILEELRKINAKIDAMKEDIDQIKEDAAITRSGVNTMIEWAEDVSNTISFPLPKLK